MRSGGHARAGDAALASAGAGDRGATLVALSVDSPSDSAELAAERGLTFPLLSDQQLSAVRAYGVEDAENGIAWPAIFVVGRDGRIAWRSLSQTYKVRAASEEIVRALDALTHSLPQ